MKHFNFYNLVGFSGLSVLEITNLNYHNISLLELGRMTTQLYNYVIYLLCLDWNSPLLIYCFQNAKIGLPTETMLLVPIAVSTTRSNVHVSRRKYLK